MKKKKYIMNFKKTIWGFFTVYARSLEKAQKEYNEGNYDEFDHKSDYKTEEMKEEQEVK